jgi:transcriptional regulator with XRE-family HTH domain
MLKHNLTSVTRDRLQTARGRATQTDIAAITGISQETLSKIERGKQNSITDDQLDKIAKATGVTKAWLLGLSSEGAPASWDRATEASAGRTAPKVQRSWSWELATQLLSVVWSYPLRGASEASWAVKESDVLRGDLGTAREDPGLGVAIVTTELALIAFGSASAGRIAGCISWATARTEKNPPHRMLGQIRDRRENVVIEERPDFRHTVALAVILARATPEHSFLQPYLELVLDVQNRHEHGGWPAESGIALNPVHTACYAVELLHLANSNPSISNSSHAAISSAIARGLAWLMKLRQERGVHGLWASTVLGEYAWDGLWVTAWVLLRLACTAEVPVDGWRDCLDGALLTMIQTAQQPRTWVGTGDAQRFRVEARVGAAVCRALRMELLSRESREAAILYAQAWAARVEGWAKRPRLQDMDVATAAFLVRTLVAEEGLVDLGRTVLEFDGIG